MPFQDERLASDQWLGVLTSISMDEFCERWVPIILGVQPEEGFQYKRACTELLERVTENNRKTVQNWLSNPNVVPQHVTKYLGLVNKLWLVRYHLGDLFPESRK